MCHVSQRMQEHYLIMSAGKRLDCFLENTTYDFMNGTGAVIQEMCPWSSERILVSVRLKEEGPIGANRAAGSERLEVTNILTYGDNVDLGRQGRWDLRQHGGLTVRLSDSVWFFTVCHTRPPVPVAGFHTLLDTSPSQKSLTHDSAN